MKINSRFGPMDVDPEDILHFPCGLWGLEACRQWVLLADEQSEAMAWLQSVERPEISLPVTSPRRFVSGYQMRVARREIAPLALEYLSAAKVLVIVGRTARGLSLNLKAPVVINPERRLGRQVITNGELPIHYELGSLGRDVRRIA
jgi:flagellar assembly factor FliW